MKYVTQSNAISVIAKKLKSVKKDGEQKEALKKALVHAQIHVWGYDEVDLEHLYYLYPEMGIRWNTFMKVAI